LLAQAEERQDRRNDDDQADDIDHRVHFVSPRSGIEETGRS
jgi:hypothetical protein